MTDVMDQADAWVRRGELVAVAMVVGSKRSTPRPLGTKMAVSANGEIAGAVSGGCVEGAVVEVAQEVLHGAAPRLVRFGYSDTDAWDVGLQCGGEIDVWVEAHDPCGGTAARLASRFGDLGRKGIRAALVTVVDGPGTGRRLLVAADGTREGTLGAPALDALAAGRAQSLMWEERRVLLEEGERRLFVDVAAPPPRLVLFGAVDYAAALCTVARGIGWQPYVVDPRGFFAQPQRFPDAAQVIAAWPEKAFAELGGIDRATFVVVLTHDPKLDDAALRLALRSDAAYIGAMGSRSAQLDRRTRLLDAGVDEADIARISAPVGLDLGALTAGETALSIMAEIVALRHGRAGGRLTDVQGRIHAVVA